MDFINRASDGLRVYIAAAYVIATAKFNDVTNICDLGCGTGGMLEYIRHNLPEKSFIGMDIDSVELAIAKSRGFSVVHGDMTKDPLPHADLYVVTEVLEHLEDPGMLLEKIPMGAWVVITVPANETKDRHDPSHKHVFEEGQIAHILHTKGYLVHRFDKAFICQIFVGKKTGGKNA